MADEMGMGVLRRWALGLNAIATTKPNLAGEGCRPGLGRVHRPSEEAPLAQRSAGNGMRGTSLLRAADSTSVAERSVATALDQMARNSDVAKMLPKPENGRSGASKQESPVPLIFKGTGQL